MELDMDGRLVSSRRTLLKGFGASAAWLAAAPAIAKGLAAPSWTANPFSLGVAAGAPSADGFVLWTRLAPAPNEPDAGMGGPSRPIGYEIASDDTMHHIVQRGTALADADFGYSVHKEHKEIRGLRPGRPYWYRFTSGAASSTIGRAMTLPPSGTAALKFAYFSCSNYEHGYFSAYRHAAEENPDFGIFLGDYIYEYAEKKHPVVRTHSGGKECETLDEYRARYTQYRLDSNLQFLHASMPSLATWDDHEVQNDYADKWARTSRTRRVPEAARRRLSHLL
ncbi:MAG: alkaline phosphatase D family protein [Rhizomicrobium sp.]